MRSASFSSVFAGIAAIASATIAVQAAPAAAQQLTSAEITTLVPGATVNIDTPLDVTLPIRFNPDGTVFGTAGKLEFYLKSQTDRGRWWVADDKLCQKWRRWFDAKTTCLTLTRSGEKFAWARDDGTKGTATITGRLPTAIADVPVDSEKKPPTFVEKVAAALTPDPPGPRGLGGPANIAPAAAAPPITRQRTATPAATAVQRPGIARSPAAAPTALPKASAKASPTVATQVRNNGGILYRVVNVAQNDTLNIRDEPGQHGRIVGTIKPDAHGIILTGACDGYWCPVLAGATTGWVNRYYLALQPMMVSSR